MALYAFDGTLNRRDTKDATTVVRRDTTETNVHRFLEFFGSARTEYLQGVGTRFHWIGKAFGGVFGMGGRYRLRRMYLKLRDRYNAGDQEIDVIGFSRGGALAIHFTNVINKYGIPAPKAPCHVGYHYYDGLGWTCGFPKLEATHTQKATIRFLGLWDAVATFGVPIKPFRNKSSKWWVKTIPGNVLRSFHAMALDEVRSTFELVRPVHESDRLRHYELWFRGVHSNVGGSYPDRGLSDIALAWMMEMFLWTLDFDDHSTAGVSANLSYALRMIGPERLPAPKEWAGTTLETLEPNPDGELGLEMAAKRSAFRPLPDGAQIHHSALLRTPNLLLDHYRANRRLLRRIPPDAVPTFDPPFFYKETPRQATERVAREAFGNIPVRAAEWFRVQGAYPVRSDEWVASAPTLKGKRKDLTKNYVAAGFLAIAVAWLEAGKPKAADLAFSEPLTDYKGNAVDTRAAVEWTVEVLTFLEYYVPNLRQHQPYRSPGPTPGGTAAPPPGDWR